MFASLLMSTSVAGAFGDRAGLFVIGYLAIQIGRTAFAVVAFRGHRLHITSQALVWELATGVLWVAGISVRRRWPAGTLGGSRRWSPTAA